MKSSTKNLLIVLSYFSIYIIWGLNFIAIYYAISTIPPFLMVGSRFLLAGAIILVFALLNGEKIPTFKDSIPGIKQGFWLNVCGTGSLVWAEQFVPSGLASIIVAVLPIWMVMLDYKNWKKYFSNFWIILGLLMGLGGVILISAFEKASVISGFNNNFYFGLTAIILGTFCWGYGSLYSKNVNSKTSLIINLAIQMFSAGVILILIGLFFGELKSFSIQNITLYSSLAYIHLVLFGSIAGYWSYIWLLRVRPPEEVGTFAFVNPIVAVISGVVLANEQLTIKTIIAMVLILTAVFLIKYHAKIKTFISDIKLFKYH